MIKINKIRIKDYKSINDTGDIFIQDRITVLAGKNESGKTNILKALDTYYQDNFSKEDVPTRDLELNPTIFVEFSILGKYFNELTDKEWLDNDVEYSYCMVRSKNVKDKLSGRLCDEILKNIKIEIENYVYENFNSIEILLDCKIDMEKLKEEMFFMYKECILEGNSIEDCLDDFVCNVFDSDNEIENKKKNIAVELKKFSLYKFVEKIYDVIIPEFKYFDNFDDMIPDEIDISELNDSEFIRKNRGFVNLLSYFKKTLPEFMKEMEEVSRTPQTKLDEYSDNITLDYQNIYKQEKLKISLNKDGSKIYINIYDIDDKIKPKKPSQRSKGLQWFLSFYLMLNSSSKNCILLIDEPGLYLHASAQEDILNFFENKLENYIIYTTHSPYLIDTKNMLRIKLVTNDRSKRKGTIVENKYYKCSDLDTITPIITAIGYNVTKSPLEFGGGLNVITEGISDRYYILAFMKLLKKEEVIHIIPSQGARATHLLASIAIGWNLKYIVILDTDKGNEDARERLKNLYNSEDEYNAYVYNVIDKENSCIEDVFLLR